MGMPYLKIIDNVFYFLKTKVVKIGHSSKSFRHAQSFQIKIRAG